MADPDPDPGRHHPGHHAGGEAATPVDLPALVARLAEAGVTVAVAESLTGGMVAAALTDVAGVSAVFRGSVTAYATDVKHTLLGVDGALLEREGAVHPEVARQMALGVRRLMGTSYGVATTGVAGPAAQDGKPVGTVYVAVAGRGEERVTVAAPNCAGDRQAVRTAAVRAALRLLADAAAADR